MHGIVKCKRDDYYKDYKALYIHGSIKKAIICINRGLSPKLKQYEKWEGCKLKHQNTEN